jgi:hypothetical protein
MTCNLTSLDEIYVSAVFLADEALQIDVATRWADIINVPTVG